MGWGEGGESAKTRAYLCATIIHLLIIKILFFLYNNNNKLLNPTGTIFIAYCQSILKTLKILLYSKERVRTIPLLCNFLAGS